ncbi:MAG TPA: hypothetical protein DCM68_05685 [Verrucomicrobia bacterium]|nr:hypothetical protein [Verrucomicrobiota bacterium]
MSELPVQTGSFKADTRRPHSRTKLRSKVRHVLAVASGMFPAMALFIYAMSLFQLAAARRPYYKLALVFLACGMVTLVFYGWARSEKMRRREVSSRNRELKYRHREESFRQEQERIQARKAAAAAREG